jgi:2-phosphosulfolactate phosphatase
MKIEILQLIEGAKKAKGLAVIIDVFRAFSLAPYAINNGAERIIPVGDLNFAFKLKKRNPDYILIGERNEQKVSGFDFGNSPYQILNQDFRSKTIVHTTSAGTQGLVNAKNADIIITGSFVNADAIVKYIKALNPSQVSLVCMGYSAERPIEEDTFCAEYIKAQLLNQDVDFPSMVNILRNSSGARFFEEKKQIFAPKEDFELCTALNRFDFVIQAEQKENYIELKRKEVHS